MTSINSISDLSSMSSVNTEWDVPDFNYIRTLTPSDSINSDNLVHSEDTNTVIIIDSDEEIETDDEHEDEYVIDNIYEEERDFLDAEKQEGHYYIGICSYLYDLLFANAMRPKTFFRYSSAHALSYLQLYSIFRVRKPTIDIMQLTILPDSTYVAVVKTHWLRIVQRTWKKIYKMRKDVVNKRMKIDVMRLFETTGRYPNDATYIPTLKGMLSVYNNNIIQNNEYLFSECH